MTNDGLSLSGVKRLLAEFKVKSEQELQDKLFKDSFTIPCIRCMNETPIDGLVFRGGNPYCKKCLTFAS